MVFDQLELTASTSEATRDDGWWAASMRRGTETLTGSHGSRSAGIISGFVLKLARQTAGLTQEGLAESLRVDVTTVAAWESGRRPLAGMPTGEFIRLCARLPRLGAPASTGRHLREAIEADLVVSTSIEASTRWIEPNTHPLGASVHRKTITNLITWPITGHLPPQLDEFSPKIPRRGPSGTKPTLYRDEQTRFFDHMVTVAERAAPIHQPLLRRQAVYLLGFDRRTDVVDWLRAEWQRAGDRRISNGDVPTLLEARSASVALASAGDGTYLHHFVSSTSETWAEIANLNYWAYWTGEINSEQTDDGFMLDNNHRSWSGAQLLQHLTDRLNPTSPHLSLNLHTLHSLVASRPSLLDSWTKTHPSLAESLERVESSNLLARTGRHQIAGLHYALRIANR